MPLVKLFARAVLLVWRVAYDLVRECFGLMAAIGGAILLVRAVLAVLAGRFDAATLATIPFAGALTTLGLMLQLRRRR